MDGCFWRRNGAVVQGFAEVVSRVPISAEAVLPVVWGHSWLRRFISALGWTDISEACMVDPDQAEAVRGAGSQWGG